MTRCFTAGLLALLLALTGCGGEPEPEPTTPVEEPEPTTPVEEPEPEPEPTSTTEDASGEEPVPTTTTTTTTTTTVPTTTTTAGPTRAEALAELAELPERRWAALNALERSVGVARQALSDEADRAERGLRVLHGGYSDCIDVCWPDAESEAAYKADRAALEAEVRAEDDALIEAYWADRAALEAEFDAEQARLEALSRG